MIKKRTPLVFMILMAIPMLSATIQVQSPKNGDSLVLNSQSDIKWTAAGLTNSVKITLWKNNVMVGVIATGLAANPGVFKWKVGTLAGGSAKTGTGYRIKIKEKGVPVAAFSEGTFSITTTHKTLMIANPLNRGVAHRVSQIDRRMLNVPPAIGVAAPKNGEVIKSATTGYPIQWKMSGLYKTGPVKIEAVLMSGGAPKYVYTIAASTPNSGQYSWNLKKAAWTPGDYTVRITTIGDGVKGESGLFKIAANTVGNNCTQGTEAQKLECLINEYRKSVGLKPVPHSSSLEKVAVAHVKDLVLYHPENSCKGNPHSWSKNGKWKGGCYDPDDSTTFVIMWNKPKEIAGDGAYGFEIIHIGSTSASGALNSWKNSKDHNDVITNQGVWKSYNWTGMAAGVYAGYYAVWFK